MRCTVSRDGSLFSPEDFIIATGEQHSVREFCEQAFGHVGGRLAWEGNGVDATGFVAGVSSSSEDLPGLSRLKEGDKLVFVDPRYFRGGDVAIHSVISNYRFLQIAISHKYFELYINY